MTTRKKAKVFVEETLGPISGCFEGQFLKKQVGQASLELKIDVDKISEHAEVLNLMSGTIVKSSGEFLKMRSEKALFFRSVNGTVVYNKEVESTASYEREVSCDVAVTRQDGMKYYGKSRTILKYDHSEKRWMGNCKIMIDGEAVTFVCARKSSHFRKLAIDIDYVDRVVWPTITLADLHDVPVAVKERKLDPFAVFADAGVKLIYDSRDSDRISDPTPHNPWTKNDMYELMMANLDQHSSGIETIWCMMASKPPDHRYMGYSFDHRGNHGFGLFLEHKSFEGIHDKTHFNYSYATRKFLHYFIHECGHALGLSHPFELDKPHELTWMNYAWKYDRINGPGNFYQKFKYSFSKSELEVIRHSPHAAFVKVQSSSVQVSSYGVVKAPFGGDHLGDADDDEDDEVKLSLRLKVRSEPYRVNELVELEVRVKNEGDVATMIEKNLSIEEGHLRLYVTYPDGKIKICQSFVRALNSTSLFDPVLLYPRGSVQEQDRHTQIITVGEGAYGAEFNVAGKYLLHAVYASGNVKVTSSHVEMKVIEDGYKSVVVRTQSNPAFLLGGVTHTYTQSVLEDWRVMCKADIEEKKKMVHKITAVATETLLTDVRVIRKEERHRSILTQSVSLSHREFLSETEDLLQYYHQKGTFEDNIHYKELVIARARVHIHHGIERSDIECSQLISDLITRGVKYSAITSIMKEYETIKAPAVKIDTTTKEYYQKRVEDILDWYPSEKIPDKSDLSGLGLQTLVSQFDENHVIATSKIVRLLFDRLDETNELNQVLDYADNLQRSFQVNHQILQWALEIFIIHSKVAKKSGIMYPEPREKDTSFMSDAAMVVTDRKGDPQETWMNYWRMDADLNYHHRHWHGVYVVGRHIGQSGFNWFGRWRTDFPELERQGELFAYMHQQMLARYDAERLSWGLGKVQEWALDGKDTLGFNAGFEFHSDSRNFGISPRPPAGWPVHEQQRFQVWEDNYKRAVDDGVLPNVIANNGAEPQKLKMDFNLSGHVLEASSGAWRESMGSIHNMGHGVFGTNQIVRGGSYMTSTVTAMRDPIFYRWHKRVDNLWQYFNNTQITELGEDSPAIEIRSSDILIKKSKTIHDDFYSFSNESIVSDEMTTFLGPPLKRYEWDNKITHDPFYYHIRFKRLAQGDLDLTFRIFICPLRDIDNRQMWIEMDKFVYRLPSDRSSAVIIRPDRHSSVIKRQPKYMVGNIEAEATSEVTGFCECGWPYNMLLPRGTAVGEEWRLCVFVSDNSLDRIGVSSSCGSLSFCGASGQKYPDKRPMGYPFTTDISIGGKEVSISKAVSTLRNTAMSSFVIKNNVSTSIDSLGKVDLWSPWLQMGLSDGTNSNNSEMTLFGPSKLFGLFRVLIDDAAMTMAGRVGRYCVRFQGRGEGNGSYNVSNVTIAWRARTSLNIREEFSSQTITFKGKTSFDVGETGLISDEVHLNGHGQDLFVTFKANSAACLLKGRRGGPTNTWVIFNPQDEQLAIHNWHGVSGVRMSPSIYCIGGLMVPIQH